MNLKTSIRQAEHSISERRSRLGVAVEGVSHAVGRHMVSPGALVTAGLVGAALQRDQRLHGLRMVAFLQAANSGLRLLYRLNPGTRAAVDTH